MTYETAKQQFWFQSTLPTRGATAPARRFAPASVVSIHAPHTGSDVHDANDRVTRDMFQSTLPTRGATVTCARRCCPSSCFNPRSPHGERLLVGDSSPGSRQSFNPRSPHGERLGRRTVHAAGGQVSIHAPHTGSDTTAIPDDGIYAVFQSTLPTRGATPAIAGSGWRETVSIHAPHTGSDLIYTHKLHAVVRVSIHAPHTGSDCGAAGWRLYE